jgi:hypothetical protein
MGAGFPSAFNWRGETKVPRNSTAEAKNHNSFFTMHLLCEEVASWYLAVDRAGRKQQRPGVWFPEIETAMALKSALEDFRGRSLRAVSGELSKLAYVAGLRGTDGSYAHWGLARVYGEAAAQQAVGDAHKGVVSAILRTPLRHLLRDMEESVGPGKQELTAFLAELGRGDGRLVPTRPGAGAERHLNSALCALASLVKTRR